ncbi:hypothetical protein [Pseudomonas putida]
MTNEERFSSQQDRAEQTRQAYKQSQAERLASMAKALAPPRVDNLADPNDGTLYRGDADNDLSVWVEKWVDFYAGDTVTLQVARGGDYENVGVTETVDDSSVFPFKMTLPKAVLALEGELSLRYLVVTDNQDMSPPITLRVDRTPPWGVGVIPEKVDIPSGVITDDYLDAHADKIQITLPAYAGQKNNDFVYLWFVMDPEDLGTPLISETLPDDRKFSVHKDVVSQWKDGPLYVVYRLIDIAGNDSKDSYFHKLSIALGKLPANLSPPVVPLATDGLLNLEDARTGVVVEIPPFDNPKGTDYLAVTWGKTQLAPEQISSQPPPYQVHVPNPTLRGEYADNTGAVALDVSYTLLRGIEPFGPETSTINVDFSVVGPVRPDPDPDWPDPVNLELLPCEVYGAVSNVKNELTRADKGAAATLRFPLYDNAKDGEIVQFYWNSTHVKEADYTVDITGASPAQVPIDWKYIEQAGNTDNLPVHYGIWDKDRTNEQQSQGTSVKVQAIVLVAPQPTFQNLSDKDALNCDSLPDPTEPTEPPSFRVNVPDLSKFNLKDGDAVHMVWKPYQTETAGPVITDAIKEETIMLGEDYPVTGFVWRIKPYADHILPIYVNGVRYGRGEVEYSFQVDSETIESELLSAKVALGLGGGGSCRI